MRLPAILNLVFHTVRLENFIMPCTDKLYHHAISIKSSSIFGSQLAKCPPVNLCLCLARHQKSNEWPTSKNSTCNHTLLYRKKPSKNSSYLWQEPCEWSSQQQWCGHKWCNGKIGNKTWCKCECCALIETSIEGVCCLEIPEICTTRFSSTSFFNVCRSDPFFVI